MTDVTRDEVIRRIEVCLQNAHDDSHHASETGQQLYDPIDQWGACLEALQNALTELTRPAPQPSEGERSWRCFHCDEVFTDAKAAREHFGSTELDEPGCKMLAKGELELLRDYRDMAARWQRCVSEDCEASRIYHSMSAKIATAERDAEQRGYDKGLADGEARLRRAAVPGRCLDTNDDVENLARECGWDNRKYMTPTDYQIWCDRMRKFVALAAAPKPEVPR